MPMIANSSQEIHILVWLGLILTLSLVIANLMSTSFPFPIHDMYRSKFYIRCIDYIDIYFYILAPYLMACLNCFHCASHELSIYLLILVALIVLMFNRPDVRKHLIMSFLVPV